MMGQLFIKQILDWCGKIGRILALPLAALPLAGLLMTLGDLTGRLGFSGASAITNGGFVLIDLFPFLAAVALAMGLAGASGTKLPAAALALAGAACWLILDQTGSTVYALLNSGNPNLARFDIGLFGGILAGALASLSAVLISHLKSKNLHSRYFRFFDGQPLIVLASAAVALPAGAVCGAVWSCMRYALTAIGYRIITAGSVGAFIYGFLNRLLMPLGLHHALNQLIWLQSGEFTSQKGILVTGDLNRFLAGDPSAGLYTAGFYPLMMFAVPAIAACLYLTARRSNRSWLLPVLVVASLVSLLSGLGEPLEFMLLLTVPLLYLVYALLSGVAQFLCFQLQIHAGFNFSAGLTDYLANWNQAIRPQMIWQVGLLLAALSFAVFYLLIVFLKLRSPGRGSTIDPDEKTDDTPVVHDRE